jgi:predicted transposase/invertase (TIGR01784 family)
VKTDTIFYRLFQSFPEFFFELINSSEETANFYQFSSVEVKQLAFRIDGVFLPSQDNQPIYFLEVQFQYDANFYRRFFGEIFLYLTQTSLSSDWRGVVIYPHPQIESEYRDNYRELFDSGRVERIYLNELELTESIGINTILLVTAETTQAIEIAKPLIERVTQQVNNGNIKAEILELIESILIYKLPFAQRQEIEAMFSLSDLKQTKFYQEAKEEGREEGIELGRQQERQVVKLETIPKLLQLGLSVEIISSTLELPLETVITEARKYQNRE